LRDPINADGTSTLELIGASGFPRHWVYDSDGRLAAKAGLADFKEWYRHAFGKHTPWRRGLARKAGTRPADVDPAGSHRLQDRSVRADQLARDALAELSKDHRREQP
jgi:hypothetical protein